MGILSSLALYLCTESFLLWLLSFCLSPVTGAGMMLRWWRLQGYPCCPGEERSSRSVMAEPQCVPWG